jgi:hypothetical protein
MIGCAWAARRLMPGRKLALRSSHLVSFPPRFGLKRVVENFNRFWGDSMLRRFPGLRKFVVKMVEVAAAGCASALVAFALDHSHHPSLPPAPTTAEVQAVPVAVPSLAAAIPLPAPTQVSPSESQTIGPSQLLRSESRNPVTSPVPKSTKVTARRETKPAPQNAELKPRASEGRPAQTGLAAHATPAQSAGVSGGEQSPASSMASEPGLFAAHRSSWVVPLSDPPRPPREVGEVVSSAM